VFFDKRNNSDGWQYLEVAPAETEFTAQWGAYQRGELAGTKTGVGFGKQNTAVIVTILRKFGERKRESGATLCKYELWRFCRLVPTEHR